MKPLTSLRPFSMHLIVGCMVGIAFLISGCTGGNMPTVQKFPNHIHASWAEWYTDMKSLKHASDGAVVGTFTAIAGRSVQDDIPYTDFTFSPTRILYDPHHSLAGQSLLIHQTGGLIEGQQVSVDDDPLFQVGEQAVLFLREYSPGHYLVVGGPSGRFHLANGQVTPMTDQGLALKWPVSETDFFTLIQRA